MSRQQQNTHELITILLLFSVLDQRAGAETLVPDRLAACVCVSVVFVSQHFQPALIQPAEPFHIKAGQRNTTQRYLLSLIREWKVLLTDRKRRNDDKQLTVWKKKRDAWHNKMPCITLCKHKKHAYYYSNIFISCCANKSRDFECTSKQVLYNICSLTK